MEFIKKSVDFPLDDYNASISTDFVSPEQKKFLMEMTTFAVQNHQIGFLEGLMVMMERDPKEALEEVKKYTQKQQQETKRMKAEEMQAQQQMQQAELGQRQRELMARQQEVKEKEASEFRRLQMQNQAMINKQKADGRAAIEKARMDNSARLMGERS